MIRSKDESAPGVEYELKRGPAPTEEVHSRNDAETGISTGFVTPYDDLFPSVKEPTAQFYLDLMRIYLGMCSGSITLEHARREVENLKENPEFTRNPSNPTLLPVREEYKNRIIENLKTLKKFNLVTVDSIRSAHNFAFLVSDMAISATDYEVLTHILNDPMASISDASKSIGLAPRTVSRSLKRLRERHSIRFACLVDVTAFGLQSIILFFSVKDGIDWPALSDGLATFPFTKSVVTTEMSELGYVVFLIPNSKRNQTSFIESINDLAPSVFDYHSLHIREAVGAETNLSLYAGDSWHFPEKFRTSLAGAEAPALERPLRILKNKGLQKGFTSNDFLVASKLAIDCRASPGSISEILQMNGWDIEPRQVSHSIRKLFSRKAVLPYAIFAGLSLSTSFCFEIICEDAWKQKILSALPHLPTSMYYFSNRGVLLWIQVPGEHQVEYYQTFRSLEQNSGVQAVHPIMTISARGSRSMLDLVTNWSYGAQGWSTSTDELDLATYLEQFDIDGQERSRADLYS